MAGMDAAALARVIATVRAHGGPAQLCVLRDGRVVLDRQFGCDPGALFLTFSASKPFVALLVHQLAERGLLDLDDPVAAYWPEYARNGKEAITIRHVLAHRAGVPFATGSMAGDAFSMGSWPRAVRQAAAARPRWPAGMVVGYHMLTFGFILGEIVQRVSGEPVAERLAAQFLGPLGLRDTHLGLPAGTWSRRVPVTADRPRDRGRCALFNLRRTRQAVIPAAGISATARDLARFYQMLLGGGRLGEVRVLRPDTIAEATRVSCEDETDQVLGRPARYGYGFQLGAPGRVRAMGALAGPGTFGHNGSNIVNAWADQERGIAFAYLTSRILRRGAGARHHAEVSDGIRAACTG